MIVYQPSHLCLVPLPFFATMKGAQDYIDAWIADTKILFGKNPDCWIVKKIEVLP